MPSDVSDVSPNQDPSVVKQWDDDVAVDTKFKDFYDIADKLKIALFSTYRPGIGPVSRSMAVAKRTGPDFLFLANRNSQKFKDMEKAKEVNLAFQDQSNQSWISVTGEATTTDNKDPRIKSIWSRGASIWFGDLGGMFCSCRLVFPFVDGFSQMARTTVRLTTPG